MITNHAAFWQAIGDDALCEYAALDPHPATLHSRPMTTAEERPFDVDAYLAQRKRERVQREEDHLDRIKEGFAWGLTFEDPHDILGGAEGLESRTYIREMFHFEAGRASAHLEGAELGAWRDGVFYALGARSEPADIRAMIMASCMRKYGA